MEQLKASLAASWESICDHPHPCPARESGLTHGVPTVATIRELRGSFPKIRRILETEGEVIISDSGEERYRLTPYSPPGRIRAKQVDYWARMVANQPRPVPAAAVRALIDDNRGNR